MKSVRFFQWRKKGFTLIEIMLVVVVLSIIVGMAIPHFSKTYQRLQLKTLTQDMASLMRYAQSRAVIDGQGVKLVVDPSLKKYWLARKSSLDPTQDTPLTGTWGRSFSIPAAIEIKSDVAFINFYPDGRIDQTKFSFCQERDCLVVSTEEQRGRVNVYSAVEETGNEE